MCRLGIFGVLCAVFVSISAYTSPTCGSGQKCPQSAPCCSEYGQCGVGAYCLGGCDPLYSYDLTSCIPAITCQSKNYVLDSLSDVAENTIYLGDASSGTNWVASGTPALYTDSDGTSSILLTMAESTVGTLLSSTHYVWYGKISATMKTSAGQGVVTAFIMMSDVKDEIDFEFVGAETSVAQSNFYWQGVPNYDNGRNLSAANTNTETHTYTIDWQPDSITWSVDGTVLRTLDKSDTYNTTDNIYHYPQTPSRIMLSLWPAGKVGNAPGTIAWAGGLIDWNSPYMTNGYYYAQILDVTVECYDPPSDANITGSKSYIYDNNSGLENSVAITNDVVVLSSFYATGDNPTYDPNGSSSGQSSASASSGAPAATNVGTVPGVSNPGGAGTHSGSGSSISGTVSNSSSSSSGGSTVFQQGSGNSNSAPGGGENAMQGSAFAVLVAFIGCMLL